MQEMLYDFNSGLIAVVLLVSMVLTIELGHRLGMRRAGSANDAARQHINGIQNAVLGILALLLGFTFSLALQRYDGRSDATVQEANAIGTAYLRAQLLPEPMRSEGRSLLRDYVDVRAEASALTAIDWEKQERLTQKAASLQAAIWSLAAKNAVADPRANPPVLFATAVNDMIDCFGKLEAAFNRHVPEVVLLLLYATFLMAGGIVGFSAGVADHRPSLVSHVMVLLVVMLVFIIVDLDRPRRGLIQVSSRSLLDLQNTIHSDPANLSAPPKQK